MIQEIKKQYYDALIYHNPATRLNSLKRIKQKLISVLLNPDTSKEDKKEAFEFLHEISNLIN